MKTRRSCNLTHKLFEFIVYAIFLGHHFKMGVYLPSHQHGTLQFGGLSMVLLGHPESHLKGYRNVPKPSPFRQLGYYRVT